MPSFSITRREPALSGSVKATTSSSPSASKATSTQAAPSSVARPSPQRSGITAQPSSTSSSAVDRRGLDRRRGRPARRSSRSSHAYQPKPCAASQSRAEARDLLVDLRGGAHAGERLAHARVAEQGDEPVAVQRGRSARRACARWRWRWGRGRSRVGEGPTGMPCPRSRVPSSTTPPWRAGEAPATVGDLDAGDGAVEGGCSPPGGSA